MREGLFFDEETTDSFIRSYKIDEIYHQGRTKFQFVHCFYNKYLGKVLFLDKKIQSAQIDEYIYHETLVHPSMITHSSPQNVLVIGGGEGATLRESLKHNLLDKVTMVDIDQELVKLCQKHLPEWSDGAFSHSKTHLVFDDARQYVDKVKEKFDVVISDLTEPVKEGPSVYLFTKEFFEKIFYVLEEDGLFVLQAGSIDPYYHQFFASCVKTLENIFPVVRPYWTFVFSFGSPWGFVLASKNEDPLTLDETQVSGRLKRREIKKLKFYHSGLHKSLFALPFYLYDSMKKARILTDQKPFIWDL